MAKRTCDSCDGAAVVCASCAAVSRRNIADHIVEQIDHGATLDEIRAYAVRLCERSEIEIGEEQASGIRRAS